MRNNPPPVIIDEIQYAPELFPYIKIAVDEARRSNPLQANGLYWLTGSQQFSMMKNVSESLAGRVGVFQMHGLSLQERMEVKKLPFYPRPAVQFRRRSFRKMNCIL
ncbi:MAG: AAA family ATPase [Lentisphaeria bacterium]|nr:MAG: AAA family ATPase [Lentisphaeria bacterium]